MPRQGTDTLRQPIHACRCSHDPFNKGKISQKDTTTHRHQHPETMTEYSAAPGGAWRTPPGMSESSQQGTPLRQVTHDAQASRSGQQALYSVHSISHTHAHYTLFVETSYKMVWYSRVNKYRNWNRKNGTIFWCLELNHVVDDRQEYISFC
jgi:hypothetical protein